MEDKTITAISTPIGVGGVSIVRLSGKKSIEIAKNVFKCNYAKQNTNNNNEIEPRKLYLGSFKTNAFTEQCLMVFFKGPHSYTGEDVVEFQCHGGVVIAKGILNELILNGATLAQPGEFTKRAFINGKLTLDKAEGVIDMINAESESEVRAGYNLMKGTLTKEINIMQDSITNILAKIEVTLDYPEVDYEEKASQETLIELNEIKNNLTKIINTSQTGMLIKNGTRVLILGKPNVGKSSILNAMLNYNRAIVTNIQGTTRDTIEEVYVYNGVKFVLIDTAGVRESQDEVEKIGIERSKQLINESDVILLVLDSSEQVSKEDMQLIELTKGKQLILVTNKSDLDKKISINEDEFKHKISVSAIKPETINKLKELIYNVVIDENTINSNVLITNLRHKETLQNAVEFCNKAIIGIEKGFTLDLVSIDIKNLWLTLGEITGENNNEEIIGRIFSSFCLGK